MGSPRPWRPGAWTAPGDPDALRQEFAGWDPRIGALLKEVQMTFRWALYDREPELLLAKSGNGHSGHGNGHGNGHGDGHGAVDGGEHAAVGSGEPEGSPEEH